MKIMREKPEPCKGEVLLSSRVCRMHSFVVKKLEGVEL
jgi:hypothetical protein